MIQRFCAMFTDKWSGMLLITFAVAFTSCGQPTVPEEWRSTEPVEITKPVMTVEEGTDPLYDDPMSCHIRLRNDSTIVLFDHGQTVLESERELDQFIKRHQIAKVSSKVYLEISSEQSFKQVEKITAVLKNYRLHLQILVTQ